MRCFFNKKKHSSLNPIIPGSTNAGISILYRVNLLPKSNCTYHFPISFQLNGIPFGSTSIEKWLNLTRFEINFMFIKPYEFFFKQKGQLFVYIYTPHEANKKNYRLKNKKEGRVCHLGMSSRIIMYDRK